jgi:hypothetical protein
MSNFKSAAKRKRELAKLDKRHAKEQKRALRKAERSGADVGAATSTSAPIAGPILGKYRSALGAAPARKPTTLAEAVEIWRSTKIVKPKNR